MFKWKVKALEKSCFYPGLLACSWSSERFDQRRWGVSLPTNQRMLSSWAVRIGEGTWRSHEDPADRIAGKGGCLPSVPVALWRAGTGLGNTRAPCICCVDAQRKLHLDHSHLFLTQTEMVQEDPNSGWSVVLKRKPSVAIHTSLMETCPIALLDSHHACYWCNGMAIVLAAFW